MKVAIEKNIIKVAIKVNTASGIEELLDEFEVERDSDVAPLLIKAIQKFGITQVGDTFTVYNIDD